MTFKIGFLVAGAGVILLIFGSTTQRVLSPLLILGGAVIVAISASLRDRITGPRRGVDHSADTVRLWRPTGPQELALVEASGWRAWPPRLPDQPIFHPVLSREYAATIARDWGMKRSGVGYVTTFQVRQQFLDRYEMQQVGGRGILEYWIPAEELGEFNRNIVGLIEVVADYQ